MPLCPNRETLPQKAEKYIPHSGLMCVVDLLLSKQGDAAETTAVVRADSPFARPDGTVEESVFIEMIAQSIAAGSGFDLTEEQRRTQRGYLLGIKQMKIKGEARVGETLNVKAVKSAQFGDFGIIEGTVLRGMEVLAEGEIKVVQLLESQSS